MTRSPHPIQQVDAGLMWFRRDLRAFDNAALHHALAQCKQVHCVFVFDSDILGALPKADRRVEFIRESLVALDADLKALCAQKGGGLHLGLSICKFLYPAWLTLVLRQPT